MGFVIPWSSTFVIFFGLAAASDYLSFLLVDMNDLGGGEAVEPGGGGVAVGPNGFAIKQVVQLQIRQILGERDGVQGVASLAEDGADFGLAPLKGLEMVLAMVEDDA